MESLARLALAIARLHLPAQLTSGSIPENTAFCVPFRGCGVAIAGVRTYDIWTLLWTSDGVMKARDRDKTGRRGSERGRENLQLTRDLFLAPLRLSRSIPFLFLLWANAANSFFSYFLFFSERRTARNQYHFLGGELSSFVGALAQFATAVAESSCEVVSVSGGIACFQTTPPSAHIRMSCHVMPCNVM